MKDKQLGVEWITNTGRCIVGSEIQEHSILAHVGFDEKKRRRKRKKRKEKKYLFLKKMH